MVVVIMSKDNFTNFTNEYHLTIQASAIIKDGVATKNRFGTENIVKDEVNSLIDKLSTIDH